MAPEGVREIGRRRPRAIATALGVHFAIAGAVEAGEPRELRELLARDPGRIELVVEYPPDGAVVNGSACGVFVAGHALVVQGETPRLDAVIVLDTSRSTIEPTGVDLNGDGVVGQPRLVREGPIFVERNSDPGDSVLAAEVAAARLLLRGLDPQRTRLAVVVFAGEAADGGKRGVRGPSEPAATVAPLTGDHALIEAALADVLAREPRGNTHMAAGLDQARRELAASEGAEKVVIFFTDGQPTLPYGPAKERENVVAVFDAADRATRAGVRIHAFAIGADAIDRPLAAVEMARRTGGSFTAVPDPGDLPKLMGELRFTTLHDVTLRNATTGAEAGLFRLAPDGSWAGFLQLEPGPNRIQASARANWGADASRQLEVRLDPARPAPELLPVFVVQRNELLKVCLEQQRRIRLALEERAHKELELELERARKELELELERTRKALRLEIDRARAKAHKRAGEQRRELQLELEEAP